MERRLADGKRAGGVQSACVFSVLPINGRASLLVSQITWRKMLGMLCITLARLWLSDRDGL